MYIYTNICMSIQTHMCLYIYLSIYLSIYPYMHMYLYVSIHIYTYMHIYMYIHIYAPPDACQGLGSLLGPALKGSGWDAICVIILITIKVKNILEWKREK
jgi:hypothetical protein